MDDNTLSAIEAVCSAVAFIAFIYLVLKDD